MLLSAFLSATILPLSSELVLAAAISARPNEVWALVAVATVGNVAGAIVNWLIGRGIVHFRDRKWFPLSAAQYARAEAMFNRYGLWSLLFSWVPIIGDPLTVIAGALRVRFWPFLILVTIGKAARYILFALGFTQMAL
ncbi:inner membrane protein YqaA [Variibacter gotjawalensis]|uniref:Inner membrane protein YqaA n=1 Tax=Variibacter gotjawalensis TaxID=1333996 RepID=A0A0S3Q0U1_9BRAD|nr:membrane protein YqaA with SNARE-associated domain [Variibacter gotjawalensis]RZS49557.1 membrane protein YqaA with SNARE-associated domain [Variibacter gotjawalensis]BAT61820.1 inner membrane protein YqaA [Variibacter gotjawalensis]